ncbi:hypothetical protein MYX82_12885, partial [Acidobacteria bacterium AH-259-D05]|nr:hypothetical protein [Acidobacteria bacterium AH-259-D05]
MKRIPADKIITNLIRLAGRGEKRLHPKPPAGPFMNRDAIREMAMSKAKTHQTWNENWLEWLDAHSLT